MVDNARSRMRTPTTDEIFGRLLLASFPIGAFACLGLGLQATDLFDSYVTVMVITATTFIQSLLRGARLTPPAGLEAAINERFGPLRDAIESTPLVKKEALTTSYRFLGAILFGIFVSVLERVVGSGMFGWAGQPADTLLSLFVVLLAAYYLAESIRGTHLYESSEWMRRIEDGVRHATGLKPRDLSDRARKAVYALLRATFGVTVRAIALMILPTIFNSGWMLAGLVLGALGIIAGFETLQVLLGAAMNAVKPTARPTPK
jgi:hypothetical protein